LVGTLSYFVEQIQNGSYANTDIIFGQEFFSASDIQTYTMP
jgi:hypothetical protein